MWKAFWFALVMSVVITARPAAAQEIGRDAITTLGDQACVNIPLGTPAFTVQVSGSGWAGTLTFRLSGDGSNFQVVKGFNPTDESTSSTTTSNGIFAFGNPGYSRACVLATDTWSGSALVVFRRGSGSSTSPAATVGDVEIDTTGLATTTKQDAGNTSIASIDLKTPALVSGRQPVDGSGVTQPVSAATLPLPSGAATSAKQDTLQAAIDAAALEEVAHGASNVGKKPVLIGCNAVALGAAVTGVDAADRAWCLATTDGQIFVLNGHPNTVSETVTVTDGDGAQTGTAIASVSAGSKFVVTAWSVACSNANTVNPDFRLAFDTDATFTANSTTGVVGHIGGMDDIGPGGGMARTGFWIGADDEDLRYSLGDPVTGSCTVSVSYFTIES